MFRNIKEKSKSKLNENLGEIWKFLLITILISVIVGLALEGVFALLGVKLEVERVEEIFGTTITITQRTFAGELCDLITSLVSLVTGFATCYFILNLVRDNKVSFNESFNYAKDNFKRIFIVSVLTEIFIALGLFCLVIPGIIVAIGLSFVNYVMIDNPELGYMDTIKKAWEVTNGHKFELFLFGLSFIGWILLCVFIIPVVYVIPYLMVAFATYYESILEK